MHGEKHDAGADRHCSASNEPGRDGAFRHGAIAGVGELLLPRGWAVGVRAGLVDVADVAAAEPEHDEATGGEHAPGRTGDDRGATERIRWGRGGWRWWGRRRLGLEKDRDLGAPTIREGDL